MKEEKSQEAQRKQQEAQEEARRKQRTLAQQKRRRTKREAELQQTAIAMSGQMFPSSPSPGQQQILGAASPGQQQLHQLLRGAASPGQELLVGAASPGLTPQQQAVAAHLDTINRDAIQGQMHISSEITQNAQNARREFLEYIASLSPQLQSPQAQGLPPTQGLTLQNMHRDTIQGQMHALQILQHISSEITQNAQNARREFLQYIASSSPQLQSPPQAQALPPTQGLTPQQQEVATVLLKMHRDAIQCQMQLISEIMKTTQHISSEITQSTQNSQEQFLQFLASSSPQLQVPQALPPTQPQQEVQPMASPSIRNNSNNTINVPAENNGPPQEPQARPPASPPIQNNNTIENPAAVQPQANTSEEEPAAEQKSTSTMYSVASAIGGFFFNSLAGPSVETEDKDAGDNKDAGEGRANLNPHDGGKDTDEEVKRARFEKGIIASGQRRRRLESEARRSPMANNKRRNAGDTNNRRGASYHAGNFSSGDADKHHGASYSREGNYRDADNRHYGDAGNFHNMSFPDEDITNPPHEEEEPTALVVRRATGRTSNPPATPRRIVRAKRPATQQDSGTPSGSNQNNAREKRDRASLEEQSVEEQSETQQRSAKRTRKG